MGKTRYLSVILMNTFFFLKWVNKNYTFFKVLSVKKSNTHSSFFLFYTFLKAYLLYQQIHIVENWKS